VGEIESNSFGIKISPADGKTTKDQALAMTGIIRGIEYNSDAQDLYNDTIRRCYIAGFDAFRITTDWKKGTFEQETKFTGIPNAIDRVWFGVDGVKKDQSDCKEVWVLTAITPAEYKKRWKHGSMKSIGEDNYDPRYWYKRESVVIAEYLYCVEADTELILFSNNIVANADDTELITDLNKNGFTEVRRRKEKGFKWYSRMMDGFSYLEPEKETPFLSNPVIPAYGNFDIIEDKIIYSGGVRRLIDPQRVHNYAKSRQIEEGALAPRKKYWLTKEQAAGHMGKLKTMNNNADPVQFYNHVDGQPMPMQQGNNDVNPHLVTLAQESAQDVESAAGMYGGNMAKNPEMQSGVAIELQQNKGDTGNIKWHNVLECVIRRAATVVLEIMPIVYDTPRSVATMAEDGAISYVDINEENTDTNKPSYDMKAGNFNVVVDIGAGFNNLQKEAVASLIEIAAVKPDILDVGADILLKNIQAPDMHVMAERYRAKMVQNGMIPVEQLTEEELEKMQAAGENQEPDPNEVAMQNALNAQAEKDQAQVIKSRADATKAIAGAEKTRAETAKVLADVTGQQLDNADKLTDQVRNDIEKQIPNMSDDELQRLV
jgi:hypothetical protein